MVKHLQERRDGDKGFTLIELMVVVLILGILMAIAIPTFLSTTNSAKQTAAEADATNAFTNEMSYYSGQNTFLGAGDGSKLDPQLQWTTSIATTATANQVYAAGNTGTNGTYTAANWSSASGLTADGVVFIEVDSANNVCYQILSDQNGTPYTAYAVTTGGCLTAAPTAAVSPTSGHANSHQNPVASVAWYTSF